MKETAIEQGCKLLDVATVEEFEEFVRGHLPMNETRTMLFQTVRRLIGADRRGYAIAFWRELALSLDSARPLEPPARREARTMLDAGNVKRLTKDEMRRAEIAFSAMCADAIMSKKDPALADAELYFALAVAAARKFDAAADELGVKLP